MRRMLQAKIKFCNKTIGGCSSACRSLLAQKVKNHATKPVTKRAEKPAIKGFVKKDVITKEVHAKLGPINKSTSSGSLAIKLPCSYQQKFQQAKEIIEEVRIVSNFKRKPSFTSTPKQHEENIEPSGKGSSFSHR